MLSLPGSGIHQLPSGEFNLPNSVQRYCDDKKAMYRQQSDLPESEWPPPLGGTYIRLALIKQGRSIYDHRYELVIKTQIDYTRGDYDKIIKRKTKVELEKAFCRVVCEGGTELQLRMLIDGAPGVGKTTLSRKVSKMWALGEILDRFWLVLLLHLRESAVSKAKNIDELFYHEDPDVQRSVTKFVKEKSGDGLLIIFDGFDELSERERSEQSLFLDIGKGKILPKCSVVVTSRPYASRSIQELPQVNRHIEVLGFTDDQVKERITEKIVDRKKAEELCTELKDRLDIASICQIPLNCSIVLYVYEQENYCLPRTLTELYDLFILHSLKRFVTRTESDRAASRLLDLKKLPSPNKEHFESLCSLALKGLEDDKLVFSQDDVENVFPSEYHKLNSNPPVLDLMTSAKSYSSRGALNTYSFLHLTIQEFLAAYQIANHSLDADKLEFFRKNLMNDRFRMVLLFLCGMTKLEFHDSDSIFSQESWTKDHVYVCHLTYEAGNHRLCKHISENCGSSMRKIELTGSRFDQLVVSNFVAHSDSQWAEFNFNASEILMVQKAFMENLRGATSIKRAEVTFECFSDAAVLYSFDNLPQLEHISISLSIDSYGYFNEKSISSLQAFLTRPEPIQYRTYSIIQKESDDKRSCYRMLSKFCKMLAECLDQNSSVTEIMLTGVRPKDIECIFAIFSNPNSVSRLTHLTCKEGKSSNCNPGRRDTRSLCTALVTFLRKNTPLKKITVDLGLDYGVAFSFVEPIKTALIGNTTLEELTLYPSVFWSNPRIPAIKDVTMSPETKVLSSPIVSSNKRKNNAANKDSSSPPTKRHCVRKSPDPPQNSYGVSLPSTSKDSPPPQTSSCIIC